MFLSRIPQVTAKPEAKDTSACSCLKGGPKAQAPLPRAPGARNTAAPAPPRLSHSHFSITKAPSSSRARCYPTPRRGPLPPSRRPFPGSSFSLPEAQIIQGARSRLAHPSIEEVESWCPAWRDGAGAQGEPRWPRGPGISPLGQERRRATAR